VAQPHPAAARAGTFLKADTMSYAATREDYAPLFAAIAAKWSWDAGYVASEEEKARAARDNLLIFAASMLAMASPIAFVGYMAQRVAY
jgi:hypothetical protein